ncbi:MAG: hypothetical protein CM1200mP20_16140 [Pseudomonadota bacterium]|nr:MAG: hypothetical protein CM1200mP20_16140 [Pseudomonadota bacterium]
MTTNNVTSLVQARRSLTELAYEKLEELVVTLRLKPGFCTKRSRAGAENRVRSNTRS